MIRTIISPSTKSANELHLPKFMVQMGDASTDAAKFFSKIDASEVLRRAVMATNQWLFTPETVPTHVKSITIAVKTMDNPPVRRGIKDGEVYIHFSNNFIKTVQADISGKPQDIISGMIIREVAWTLLVHQFDDDSYPKEICSGLANYIRLKEGFFPPHERTTDGVWYDFGAMPYFLDWVEKKYGDGTVRRLHSSFGAQFDEGIFEIVTETPISCLWRMYCASISKEEKRVESNEEEVLPRYWVIPRVQCCIGGDLEHKGVNIFFDSIIDPINALNKAVRAVFKHLYTPETVPTNVEGLCLVLQPGMEETYAIFPTGSQWEIHLSLDKIKSSEPSAQEIMMLFVFLVVFCCNTSVNGHSWLPELGAGIGGFVLYKEGLTLPEVNQQPEGDWDASWYQTANFLVWIESTTGEGIVQKLNLRNSYHKYNASWFVELTGKTVDELWDEYKSTLPEAIMSEGLFEVPNNDLVRVAETNSTSGFESEVGDALNESSSIPLADHELTD